MSRRLLIPLVALVVTLGGLLGCAAWNRGAMHQRITLTERELSLPWQWRNETAEDDGQLRLPLEWQRRDSPLDERTWLTEEKLRALGFDVSVPIGAPEASRAYGRTLPKIGWVVLEYDGAAWQEMERRRRLRANVHEPRYAVGPSRLVAVDAGRDREALARRYAQTPTLIVPAIFQMAYVPPDAPGGPLMYGYVQRLVVREVSVPRRLRDALNDLRGRPAEPTTETIDPAPRFDIDLAVGRSGYPWVVDVRRR